ncbi:MAG: helix-turn-helix domain-containing protein [Acidimicrobiales bacterium]|nr:helix-turn-helix domain-containing protein [Acidimicrobiales bacterium]
MEADSLGHGKLLLTPTEAAKALSLGRTKLFQLIGSGELQSITISRSRRIPVGALVDFIERLRRQSSDIDAPSSIYLPTDQLAS